MAQGEADAEAQPAGTAILGVLVPLNDHWSLVDLADIARLVVLSEGSSLPACQNSGRTWNRLILGLKHFCHV
jgi:hypothetical protein